VEINRLVAHASFSDTPLDPNINIDGKRWKGAKGLEGVSPLNTLFMSIVVFNPEVSSDTCLLELIAKTFLSCAHPLEFVVIEAPTLDYTGRKKKICPIIPAPSHCDMRFVFQPSHLAIL
jgi:hypothetical protein